jgi:hypothetical protein
MFKRLSRFAAGAMVVTLGASVLIVSAGASAGAAAPSVNVTPKFAVLHTAGRSAKNVPPASGPTTFNFKYVYKNVTYNETFIGTNPKTGASTTIPVDVIPIKLTLGSTVMNPNSPISGGNSAVQQTLASPLFNKSIDYVQGGTDLGKTQYEDAFERAALWKKVKKNTTTGGYHVLFGTPTVEPLQSVTVPSSKGVVATAFGTTVIVANINWFDPIVQGMISSLGIPASTLPIFVVVNSYLSDNSGTSGCCIGGYHNYNGTQTYAEFSYITTSGAFSQDVSALSHELGEWVDDPFTNNTDVPASCGTQGNDQRIYEVGDPLEIDANFGDYAYTVGGFTWHLQDLVLPPYFGAATPTSVNGWTTFQGTSLSVCQNGG